MCFLHIVHCINIHYVMQCNIELLKIVVCSSQRFNVSRETLCNKAVLTTSIAFSFCGLSKFILLHNCNSANIQDFTRLHTVAALPLKRFPRTFSPWISGLFVACFYFNVAEVFSDFVRIFSKIQPHTNFLVIVHVENNIYYI